MTVVILPMMGELEVIPGPGPGGPVRRLVPEAGEAVSPCGSGQLPWEGG